MNIENLSGVEILYNCDLKNKIIIKIPGTKFYLICTCTVKTGLWNMHVMEMMGTTRGIIASQIDETLVAKAINSILNNPIKTYKHIENIKKFTEEFKTIIININRKQQNGKRKNKCSKRNRLQ